MYKNEFWSGKVREAAKKKSSFLVDMFTKAFTPPPSA